MKLSLSALISLSMLADIGQSLRTVRRSADCPIDWTEDPNDSTQCLPDSGDFTVTCGAQQMTVTFAYNHLYENIETYLDDNSWNDTSTTEIGTYGNGTCSVTRDADWDGSKFSITIPYNDSCVTLDHVSDYITISSLFEGSSNLATETDYDNNVEIHVGQVLSFTAHCSWYDSDTIDMNSTMSVYTDDFTSLGGTPDSGDTGYTEFTPTFTMSAYSDSTFSITIDPTSDSIEIGEMMYFQIESDDDIGSDGMFEWYVTECTVYQTSTTSNVSYPIITDDSTCGSNFLSVDTGTWTGGSSSSTVEFQMIAFQFANAATDDIFLQCDIHMCLATENCQPTCGVCSTGYGCL